MSFRGLVLFQVSLWALAVSGFANSYSYALLFEKDLPREIRQIAAWNPYDVRLSEVSYPKTGLERKIINEGDLIPKLSDLQRFLDDGQFRARFVSPEVYKARDALKRESEDAAVRFRALTNVTQEQQIARAAELERFQHRYNELHSGKEFSGSRGALLDSENRIFLWRLYSPSLLQLYSSPGTMCYLELPEGEEISLVERPETSSMPPLEQPELNDPPTSSGYFLPSTGPVLPVPITAIQKFLESGECQRVEKNPGSFKESITSFWYGKQRERPLLIGVKEQRDLAGHVIITHATPYAKNTSTVFVDQQFNLWKANLQSDSCMRIEDRYGRHFYLLWERLRNEGHGVQPPSKNSAFSGRGM